MKRAATFSRTFFCTLGVLVCLLLSTQAQAAQKHIVPAKLAQTLHDGGDVSAGDLDGDRLSDLVLTARHTLEISLSNSTGKQTFQFPARHGGLTIAARDVDGDLDLDLVITSRLTGEGVGILINDGLGVFSEGDLSGRKPWVWGHGNRLSAGTPEETSVAVTPAGNEDASTIDEASVPALHLAPKCALNHTESTVAQTRGAFYIRPPPSSR